MRSVTDKKRSESAWYTCLREAKPFREIKELPLELRLPRWFPFTLVTVSAVGLWVGIAIPYESFPGRLANSVLIASLFLYVTVSMLDSIEHFRLEKHVTGQYLSCTVVPLGESLIHTAIVVTLVVLFALARPLSASLNLRDWLVVASPLLFLVLGWSDELIYHRRRALHREDILHTVSHLAAGFMVVSLFIARVFDWSQFR